MSVLWPAAAGFLIGVAASLFAARAVARGARPRDARAAAILLALAAIAVVIGTAEALS